MGNQLSSSQPSATIADLPTLLSELPAFTTVGTLGGSKILKTAMCEHNEGRVVVRVYPKRFQNQSSNQSNNQTGEDLRPYIARLEDVRSRLSINQAPNVLPFAQWTETDRAAFIFRQFMAHSVYDRFHTHPFLTIIEKTWLAYQLIAGLKQLHSVGLRHGDIKTENLIATTWNWLFITDLPFFKPTFLPANNPADYSFYFETSRRRCYLAPERFYTASERAPNFENAAVTEAMDIFSAGCCIAEIFLEGEALFDLPQLLSYKEGGYDPLPVLQAKIHEPAVRELVAHMIQLDPNTRLSAKGYLTEFESRLFPTSFPFLHSCLARMIAQPELFNNPDQKISFIHRNQRSIIQEITGLDLKPPTSSKSPAPPSSTQSPQPSSASSNGPQSSQSINQSINQSNSPINQLPLGSSHSRTEDNKANELNGVSVSVTRPSGLSTSLAAARPDNSRHPLLNELAMFEQHLQAVEGSASKDWSTLQQEAVSYQKPTFSSINSLPPPNLSGNSPSITPPSSNPSPSASPFFPMSGAPSSARGMVPDSPLRLGRTAHSAVDDSVLPPTSNIAPSIISVTPASNVLTMVVTLICSCIQNTQLPRNKLTALDLLFDLGQFVDDEVRLGRLVPYAIAMLNDAVPIVRCKAVTILTQLLRLVTSFPQSDAHVFPEYIFPALSRYPHDSDELVRVSYAANIATLAETARRFLDIAQQNLQQQALTPQRGQNPISPSPSMDLLSSQGSSSSAATASYDSELVSLQELVLKLVIDMLTVGGSAVKRALLVDITRLCVFLGRKRVNNELLPHLITVLNDRDWQLRVAFFDHIVGVSVFVGRIAFQNFVLPCIEQSLFDVEETVIQRAVYALTQLVVLSLFEKKIMLEIVDKASPLLCHPSAWIRNETITLMLAMGSALGVAKTYCFLIPALHPFLMQPISQLSRSTLIPALKPALTRFEFHTEVYPNQKYVHTASQSRPMTLPSETSMSEDGRRDFSVSSSISNPPSLASVALTAQSEVLDSGWKSDPELISVMTRYLQKVSMAVVTKGFNSGESSATESLEDEVESYAALDQYVPVYQIEVERTTPAELHPSYGFSPADRVQQDLLDSLGMQVQKNPAQGSNAARGTGQAGQPAVAPIKRREPIRQPASKVQPYIIRALSVPAPPPNLGQLREGTITHSPFYGSFRALEAGYSDTHDPKQWRPRGVLVATLTEHSARVNSLSVSRDNVFIASGSDDGSVKIWDCQRLKLTANARSQLTWNHTGGPVTALTVCDSSHSVASACASGALAVMKVEYAVSSDDGAHKYGGLSEVRKIDASREGSILAVEHFNTLTQSLLVYGTQQGGVHSWDLRARESAFDLKIEPAMGLLSALAIGPTPYCLCAGTTRGFIIVWDLRFHLPVQVWRHAAKTRITSLTPYDGLSVSPRDPATRGYQHPTKGPLLFVTAEGQNQVAAFDLLTSECRLVCRVQDPPAAPVNMNKGMKPVAKPRANISPLALPSLRQYLNKDYPTNLLDESFLRELEALATTTKATLANPAALTPQSMLAPSMSSILVCPFSFCLTAGSDRVVRYWDFKESIDSYRLTGPELDDDANARFHSRYENSTVVLEECTTFTTSQGSDLDEKARLAMVKRSRGAQPPPSAHTSAITAMKALEFPQKMIATAAADGNIKIWI